MEHRPEAIMISVAWERAKGELRAAVAAIGAMPATYGNALEPRSRYEVHRDDVEAFIKEMDDRERFCL